MKLLGVQIANGFSPEAQVFAHLLAHRGDAYDARVLLHDWPGDTEQSAARFADIAQAPTVSLDTGWRPNERATRGRVSKLQSIANFRRSLPELLRAATRYDPDVVYSNQQIWDCAAATYIAKQLRKPQIVHLHYTVGPWLQPSPLLRPLLGDPLRRLRECDLVVTVSDFIRDEALQHGVNRERVVTVHNMTEPQSEQSPATREAVRGELGLPCSAVIITMAARLDPYKGQSDAIAAFARAAKQRPSIYLLLAGIGALRGDLEREARATEYPDRIRFIGFRDDMPRILAATDIFIHPSRNEPFGLSVLEAQAAGLPVVAYHEGATAELVQDGVTGLLAAPGDIGDLAARLEELVSNPLQAAALGYAGREHVAREFQPDYAASIFAERIQTLTRHMPVSLHSS